MKGYKATDKDMKCRGYQFELGKWHEHEGSIIMCEAGFHFCDQPSGPWCYYLEPDTRIFEVEAEDILDTPIEPGAENKRVCKRIKLVREITPGLTGDDKSNTGHWNTGHWNTGDSNTGYRNTGNRNTGDSNTGHWNATNLSCGFFCVVEPKVISFDEQTDLSREEYLGKYPEAYQLGDALMSDEPIDFEPYKNIPNITPEKLLALHEKFRAARKVSKGAE